MLDIEFSLTKLAKQWGSGSEATRHQRLYSLCTIGRTLVKELSFKGLVDAQHLKAKHVELLLKHWQDKGLSSGTIKNSLSHLRTWADWIGKNGIIPKSNDALGAARRVYVPQDNRAFRFSEELSARVPDVRLHCAFELQEAFGLRREEALKLIPTMADKGKYLELVGSWCKNGKPRAVPVRTEQQRALLERAKRLTGPGRPLGGHLGNYRAAMKAYERATVAAGMDGGHGLRHQYAQDRYLELTGRAAPVAGGISGKELTPEQRALDKEARLAISNELGHAREQITVTYLGR